MKRLGLIFFVGIWAIISAQVDHPLKFFPKLNKPEIDMKKAAIGRLLFYEPLLSIDSTKSCGSCHQQKFAFGDNLNFSEAANGQLTTRNTPTLFNLDWDKMFFWDGREKTLKDQAFVPVRSKSEMGLNWIEAEKRIKNQKKYSSLFSQLGYGIEEIDSNIIAECIAEFERRLVSDNSKYDSVMRGETRFTKLEADGFVIVNDFSMGNCMGCHPTDANALGRTGTLANNGFEFFKLKNTGGDKEISNTDQRTFKVPSLRNLTASAPYMHNGDIKDLDAVVTFYNSTLFMDPNIDHKLSSHQGKGLQLSSKESASVLAFLKQ